MIGERASATSSGRPRMPSDRVLLSGAVVVVLLLGLCAVLGAVANYAVSRAGGRAVGLSEGSTNVTTWIVLAGAAVAIIRQQRRQPIGWLLMGVVVLDVLGFVCWELALLEQFVPRWSSSAAGGWAATSEALLRLQIGAVLLVLLVFPTGRPPTPRWKPLVWLTIGVFVVWATLHVLTPGALEEDELPGQTNPWGVLGDRVLAGVRYVGLPAVVVVACAVFCSLVVRFRTSRGDERQQVKWVGLVAAGVAVSLLGLLVAAVLDPSVMGVIGDVLIGMLEVGLPLAVVLAVTRYRLYDLDLLVNRTVVYTAVTLVLLSTYLATVLLITWAVVGVGWRSPPVVAVATMLATVSAAPVHRRIQGVVDRLFQRRAWAAARRIDAFAAASRTVPQPPTALRDLLAEVLNDPGLQLGLWLRDRDLYAAPDNMPLDVEPAPSGQAVLPVNAAGAPVAVLLFDDSVARDQRLLTAVTERAGLLLENARLQAEVLTQLAEVQASRTRIVEAADAERRRVERDLHDGAQQRLVAVALRTKMAARQQPESVATVLTALSVEIQAAITELRELARGIHPAAVDRGLLPALEGLASRSPIGVHLDLPEPGLDIEKRLTAYYVAAEAITNAVKYAEADRIDVDGQLRDDEFTILIHDNGRGGAHATAGSGLAGLADRVAAVGGRLSVLSPPGAGTLIKASLPCAS